MQNEEKLILDISSSGNFSSVDKKKNKPLTIRQIFQGIDDWLINSTPISTKDKLLFFQLLGNMINAGLPILDSLNLLEKESRNVRMKRVIKDMKEHIETGESLASAMRRNDDVFDEASCAVIEAGERSGKLNEITKELVGQYERIDMIKDQVKSVMIYPIVVFCVMILLTVVVIIFVIPKLKDLFGGTENLPLPTQILLGISNFVVDHWLLTLILIFGVIALIGTYISSKTGKRQIEVAMLSMPIVSGILQQMILSKITRIFGFLISAGVPIIQSLKIAAHIAGNDIYRDKLILTAEDLSKGILIAENISDNPKLFPTMLVNMISIGEKTASLDTIMIKVAQYFDDQLQRKIKNLSQIMEPIILVIIAGGAIFMIMAIYLPILKMNERVLG